MQRIAVVTGANKGIGYEIAKQLLTTCTVVVLACRGTGESRAAREGQEREACGVDVVFLDEHELARRRR